MCTKHKSVAVFSRELYLRFRVGVLLDLFVTITKRTKMNGAHNNEHALVSETTVRSTTTTTIKQKCGDRHSLEQNGELNNKCSSSFTAANMNMPNTPSRCTWTLPQERQKEKNESSPHTTVFNEPKHKTIMPNVLDAIGWTPLVRLNRIAKSAGLQCELLAKCEYFNAGGSVKDRIGRRMVEEAERDGTIQPGISTIIEPTSGNTGIGLALAAAVKGYRCIIVMPEKMSQEKVDVLKALGAEIIRTPTAAPYDSPESHIGVAQRLQRDIPHAVILDQYKNAYNPVAHYDQTAEEIIEQCDGKIDMIVCGAGTGGTVAGIGRKFKEKLPHCKIVGVDPVGSVLAIPEELNKLQEGQESFYEVEGIGYDFLPTVLDRSVVDQWYKSSDHDSLLMSRRLIREEGLLCGASSGTAVHAAVEAARQLQPHLRCVVILPDGVRNYMTKFLNDKWMLHRRFLDDSGTFAGGLWWSNLPLKTLSGISKPLVVEKQTKIHEAVDLMHKHGYDQLPVIDNTDTTAGGLLIGVVTLGTIMSKLAAAASGSARGRPVDQNSAVSAVMFDKFLIVHPETKLGKLSALLSDQSHFALIVSKRIVSAVKEMKDSAEKASVICGATEIGENADEDSAGIPEGQVGGAMIGLHQNEITGIVTSIDLMSFVANEANEKRFGGSAENKNGH